jgi:hypothetical protein
MKSKTGLYSLSILTFTLLLSVLRTACYLTAYESKVGYFASTPLVLVARVLYLLVAVWCLACPLLFLKETRPTPNPIHGVCGKLAGSLFLFSGLCLLIDAFAQTPASFGTVAVLRPILGVFALLSSLFFFTEGSLTPKMHTAHAAFGFAGLAFLFALLFYIYFDMYVTINSPIKNSLQLSILSAMLFLLYEIRDSIGRPPLRISIGIQSLCAIFCVPTAISQLIFERSSMCGEPERVLLSPFFSIALLAIGIFALSKLLSPKNN